MRVETLHLDCAIAASPHTNSQAGPRQCWPHRPMVTARSGPMVTLGPYRLAEQPLRLSNNTESQAQGRAVFEPSPRLES